MDTRCYVHWFTPPQEVHYSVKKSESDGNQLYLCDCEALDFPRDALGSKPRCLHNNQCFWQAVAFAPVLDLLLWNFCTNVPHIIQEAT